MSDQDAAAPVRTAVRTCPLCEAGCGLEITLRGEQVVRIRGDRDDVFSHGFLCPKGSTLQHLHEDPDRLRRPLVKRDGEHVEVDWPEAWQVIAERLPAIIERDGREAVGVYLGNPSAHSLSALTFNRVLLQALGTKRRFSASTVDQMPRQVAAGYVFGTALSVPVPDLDRTDLLVILGANPYASNGSLCTAPDFPGRLEALRERGGRVVVVDPRRTRTAEEADEWLAIRPGTDALLLAAVAATLAEEGLVDPGDHVRPWLAGLDEVVAALAPFTAEAVAPVTGIDAETIRRLARDLAAAPSASVYGRMGTTTSAIGDVALGTATSWLVDVVNILSGNLDRAGGAMFSTPASGGITTRGAPGVGSGFRIGRGHTKVRNLPEVAGEYPVAALAEEITDGGLRALVTVGGNPVLSIPNAGQLDEALERLELMVSVDMYLNETTRHADVILPVPSQLQRSHYDLALLQFAVRNVANYSPAVLPLDDGQPDEWEILAKLALIAQGQGPDADPDVVDAIAAAGLVQGLVRDPTSNVHGRDPDELIATASAGGLRGPERLLDVMLRTGPFGDGFGANPDGLSLDELLANPHGVDLGPLVPRLPEILRTPTGRIELAAPELLADLARLAGVLHDRGGVVEGQLVLVGRRHLRSNNSWMHNVRVLVKGRPRCTLQVHPDDADRLGLRDGEPAQVTSRAGSVLASVEVTDAIRPGVVSLPHGWGHGQPGTRMRVAAEHAGVSSNRLADCEALDPLSGTSVLNGIPVSVVAASS
jgi:anaerobic selenocysteine-containing dehydrogenase